MAIAHLRVLRGLEDAGYPTGTIGPAHAGLPGLADRAGDRLVERLLELDTDQLDQLNRALQQRTDTAPDDDRTAAIDAALDSGAQPT